MEYKRTYIDGYNVLRKISRLERMMRSNADAARRGLVASVQKRSRSLGHVFVVFDGKVIIGRLDTGKKIPDAAAYQVGPVHGRKHAGRSRQLPVCLLLEIDGSQIAVRVSER